MGYNKIYESRLFIQQVFIEHLLCAQHCTRCNGEYKRSTRYGYPPSKNLQNERQKSDVHGTQAACDVYKECKFRQCSGQETTEIRRGWEQSPGGWGANTGRAGIGRAPGMGMDKGCEVTAWSRRLR